MKHEISSLCRRVLVGVVCLVVSAVSVRAVGLQLMIHNPTGSNQRCSFTGGGLSFADTFGPGGGWKYLGDMNVPVTFTVEGVNGASGSGSYTFTVGNTSIDGFTFGSGSGQGNPPPTWTLNLHLTNPTPYPITYSWKQPDGTRTSATVPPGKWLDISITAPAAYDIELSQTSYTPDGVPTNNPIPVPTSNWAPNPTPTPTDVPPTVTPPPSNVPSSNIPFPDTSDLAKEATLRMGFNAMRETTAGGFNSTISTIGYGNNLLKTLADNSSAFVVMNGNLVSVKTILEALKGDTAALQTIGNQINQNLGVGNTALAGIKSAADGIAGNTAAASTKLDGLGGKLDTVIGQGTARASAAALDSATLQRIQENTFSGSGAAASLLTKVGEAVTELGLVKAADLAVADKASQIKTDTAQIATKAGAAVDALATINGNLTYGLGNLQAPLDAINAQIPGIRGKLDQLTASAQEGVNLMNSYLPKLATIDETLRVDMQPKVMEIADNTRKATNYLDGIQSRLSEVTNRLGGITNWQRVQWDTLKDISTNTWHPEVEDTAAVMARQSALGAGAAMAGSNVLQNLSTAAGGIGGNRACGGVEGAWVVGMAGYSLDLNPMHVEGVAELAAWFRNALAWLAALACVFVCWRTMEEKIHAGAAAQQGRAQLNIPVLGTAMAEVIAVASVVLLAALPAAFAAWVYSSTGSAPWSAIMGNPFSETGGSVGQGLWLLNQWVPVGLLVGYVAIILSFKLYATAVFWFVTGSIRALAG